MRSSAVRASVVVLCLACAGPAVADDLSGWSVRGEGGVAVVVPFGAVRVGRALTGHAVWFDAGMMGGEGFATLTGGLEARAWAGQAVSPYTRAELGALRTSHGEGYVVMSLGVGLSVRLDERWSARAGLTRSLSLGERVAGPDAAQLGLEYRW